MLDVDAFRCYLRDIYSGYNTNYLDLFGMYGCTCAWSQLMQPVSFVSSLRVQHGYVASDLAHGPTLPKPHPDKFGRLGILTQPLRHHVPLSACSSVPVAPVALVAVVFAAFVAGSAPRPQVGQIATASSSSPLQDGGLTGLMMESMVNHDHLHSISLLTSYFRSHPTISTILININQQASTLGTQFDLGQTKAMASMF